MVSMMLAEVLQQEFRVNWLGYNATYTGEEYQLHAG